MKRPKFYFDATPSHWFWAQVAMLTVVLFLRGHFHLMTELDSPLYRTLSARPWFAPDRLTSFRTIGYPLFLKLVWSVFPENALPLAQYAVFIAAIWYFFRCLIASGLTEWTALAMASSLLYSSVMLRGYHHLVLTESVGLSLTIVALGALMRSLRTKSEWRHWAIYATGIFLAYQVRPAYLILFPVVFVFAPFAIFARGGRQPDLKRPITLLVAASLLPYFAFLTFRWFAIGEWGLVSFSGHNISNIAVQFLDDKLVAELPPSEKELAKALLAREQELVRQKKWTSPVLSSHKVRHDIIMEQYLTAQWSVCASVLGEKYSSPPGIDANQPISSLADRALHSLSLAIIARRPLLYLNWWLKATYEAFLMAFSSIPLVLEASGLFALLIVSCWLQVRTAGVDGRSRTLIIDEDIALAASLMGPLSLLLFLSTCFAVTLVEVPLLRYLEPAAIFLPTIPVLVFLAVIRTRRAAFVKTPRAIGGKNTETHALVEHRGLRVIR